MCVDRARGRIVWAAGGALDSCKYLSLVDSDTILLKLLLEVEPWRYNAVGTAVAKLPCGDVTDPTAVTLLVEVAVAAACGTGAG